ncbi:MAG TPA: ABC transporter substrate-binding protein, partial [Actinomycetota bacterium]|nr:ABC transporter substrate-binding protein [Actinomycetota bacterium]
MTRSRGWSLRLATLFAGAAIVAAACGPAASPPASGTPTSAPPTSGASGSPVADRYPEEDAPCGDGTYTGNLKSIVAPDPMTVVFTMCAPDVAFLQKAAFSVFAINDSDWIETHAADGTIKDLLNGTGPYKLDAWTKGTELTYSA